MKEHRLKTIADYWDALASGEKNFEVRRDDRGFQKGDVLILMRVEWHTLPNADKRLIFSPGGARGGVCEIRRKITYVLTGGQLGIEPGYVVLGLKKA